MFNFFLKKWAPVFSKFVSASYTEDVVMYRVAAAPCVLDSEKNAVFNSLLLI